MKTDYNVFEILPEGSARLRAFVKGPKHALWMLKVVGSHTRNECFAASLNTLKVIGRVNEGRSTANQR